MNVETLFDLHSRVAIVTGGAGLLGAEFCRTLAEAGARVIIADINAEAGEKVATDLRKENLQAIAVACDVTSPDAIKDMVSRTLHTYSRLDILVNSAALDPKFDPQHTPKRSGVRSEKLGVRAV